MTTGSPAPPPPAGPRPARGEGASPPPPPRGRVRVPRLAFAALDLAAGLAAAAALLILLLTGGGIAERAFALAALLLLAAVGAAGARLLLAAAAGRRPLHAPDVPRLAAVGAALFLAWGATSLLPMSAESLAVLSPEAGRWERLVGPILQRPARVSLDPAATRRALAEFALYVALALAAGAWAAHPRRRALLVGGLLLLGAAALLVGLVRMAGPQPTGRRHFAGPFANRNHFAGLMAMLAPLAAGTVAMLLQRAQRRAERRNAIYGLGDALSSRLFPLMLLPVAFAAATLLSLSRSGAAALGAGMLLWGALCLGRRGGAPGLAERRPGARVVLRAAAAMALVGTVVFLTLGIDPLTERLERVGEELDPRRAGSRAQIWRDTWRLADDFRWTGAGLGSFYGLYLPYASAPTDRIPIYAHQEYLQVLAETGLPGLGFLLATLAGVFLAGARRIAEARGAAAGGPAAAAAAARDAAGGGARHHRHHSSHGADPTEVPLFAGATAGVAAIALQSLGEFPLRIPLNAAVAALLVGLLFAGRGGHARRRTDRAAR